jgi:hypothetical protein
MSCILARNILAKMHDGSLNVTPISHTVPADRLTASDVSISMKIAKAAQRQKTQSGDRFAPMTGAASLHTSRVGF